MYDGNRPVGSTFTSTEVFHCHLGVTSNNSLELISSDSRDRTVNIFNSGQVSSTVTSGAGAHHSATSRFLYRHQHQVAPSATAALAAVTTSTSGAQRAAMSGEVQSPSESWLSEFELRDLADILSCLLERQVTVLVAV